MKVIKWLVVCLIAILGLPLGAYIGFGNLVAWSSKGVGIDGGAGSWVLRSLFHDGSRYYELTAKLEIEGEPVEITRVIECQPYFAHRLTDHFQKHWYADQEAMTHRLPDGSGVIIVVPKLCEKFAHPQPANAPSWKAFPALPADFIPLILWTANADNPIVIEGYHSFASLSPAGSRVRFLEIELRNSSQLKARDYSEEFAVLQNAHYGGLRGGKRKWKRANFKGYYLATVGEEDWRKVPELSAAMDGVSESGFLSGESWRQVARHLRLQSGLDQYSINGALVTRQLGPRSTTYAVGHRVLENMHGFELRHDSLVFSAKRQGVITYLSDDLREEMGIVEGGYIKLDLNGYKIKWPTRQMGDLYYYNSESGEIHHVNVVFVNFTRTADID